MQAHMDMTRDFPKQSDTDGTHIVVVGAGGLIGSFLTPLLAFLPVSRVTLIDPERYSPENRAAQNILPGDVGRSKARVQARRLRRLNPALEVRAVTDFVENVPLAQLRCDVLLGALDSKRSRTIVNERAWYLSLPWVDSGVNGEGLLARVNVYRPGPGQPCLECAFSQRDYDAIEQTFPCGESPGEARPGEPPATNSPSFLGALAAALLAGECKKLLDGDHERAAIGRQVVLDILYHNHYVTTLPFNAACRMPVHGRSIEHLERCGGDVSVGQIFALANGAARKSDASAPGIGERGDSETAHRLEAAPGKAGDPHPEGLRVIGQSFITGLTCRANGHGIRVLRLRTSLADAATYRTCGQCGADMIVRGSDAVDRLYRASLSANELALPLLRLGIREGDVVGISTPCGDERYFEILGEGG